MNYTPIAIVGQACLLPGAFSPDELWDIVAEERDVIARAPRDYWRADPASLLVTPEERAHGKEGCLNDLGGFVRGFEERFDSSRFSVEGVDIGALDPIAHWLLHTGREALVSAGLENARLGRVGAIVGNLAYPTVGMAAFAEKVWLGTANVQAPFSVSPFNRFSAGLPVHLMCQALGLGAGGFSIDAACASSLYAIDLACAWLRSGRADAMLAGGVNRGDGLTLHAGFTALAALSPSGRSRPFHKDADGLLPAEGCALVVLKRLETAISDGDDILGVIRGVGLSNDGRAGGFLAPSVDGQKRALKSAYEVSGVSPTDVSLIECHATGTSVGDAAEVTSTAELYKGLRDVPIGSLKSNLGHLITASGAAALIKVIMAMRHETRPATLHADVVNEAIAGSPFRVLKKAEPWRTPANGRRIAAVTNFGFGGNNAHLLIESWTPAAKAPVSAARKPPPEIAIVGMGAHVGTATSLPEVRRQLFGDMGATAVAGSPAQNIELSIAGMRFPPKDLQKTLPQQILILRAAIEAVENVAIDDSERLAILIGMQVDAEACRHAFKLRLRETMPEVREDGLATPPLDAACVLGCMPNIVANRLNSYFNAGGPSFTFAGEELSGIRALETAIDALVDGRINTAIVGAVDLSIEPVHEAATREMGPVVHPAADAACAFVLKRAEDALRDGDTIHALVGPGDCNASGLEDAATPRFGHAHAASGLLQLLAGVLQVKDGVLLQAASGPAPLRPWLADPGVRVAQVRLESLGGQTAEIGIRAAADSAGQPIREAQSPRICLYEAETLSGLVQALRDDRRKADIASPSNSAARRIVLVASAAAMPRRIGEAIAFLEGGATLQPPAGVFFADAPVVGEISFVFTGAAAAYPGMGRDLTLAFPDFVHRLRRLNPQLGRAAWVFESDSRRSDFDDLCGASFLSQFHAVLTQQLLGVRPQAAIGLSSGETNALFALGAWRDIGSLLDEIDAAGIYTTELSGEYRAVREWWRGQGIEPGSWAQYRILSPVDLVCQALVNERAAHLAIINSPRDCIIAGEAKACLRVIEALGHDRAAPLDMQLAVHTPALGPSAALWRKLHHRPTTTPFGVRFYGNAHNAAYPLTSDSVADALTGQALRTVDFPKTILRAWEDGVRIFIEHGPRGLCTRWIDEILGERPHLAIALDVVSKSSLQQFTEAAATLLAHGVALDLKGLQSRLADDASTKPPEPAVLALPAHWPPVSLVTAEPEQRMELAPSLGFRWLHQFQPRASVEPDDLEQPADAVAQNVVQISEENSPARREAATAALPDDAVGLKRLVAAHARVSQAHEAFMQRMVSVQQGFDRVSAVAWQALIAPPPQHPARNFRPSDIRAAAPIALSETPKLAAPAPQSLPAPTHAPEPKSEATVTVLPQRDAPRGPRFGRSDLEKLASDRISDLFGPLFKQQDGYRRQVRMPQPPLLLADRVTGIDAEPGSMGKGTIWTETDVAPDAWYLHAGHMPAGIAIESGQADLLLISWLGADFLNRGERVYRLLGCDMTLFGGLPKAGDTLRYDIHIDGHAKHDDVRLFFFHYDLRIGNEIRLRVRNGQAGFFTDEELANSDGILWSAETAEPRARAECRIDPPEAVCERRSFDATAVRAFAEGRLIDCFGPAFALSGSHTRTPGIPTGRMQLIREAPVYSPDGGPWGRGYLRASTPVSPNDWFFDGHFKNDPCMPGTLMLEAALQAMGFFMAAMGFTLRRDGWRFEPVTNENVRLMCRGQVLPTSQEVIYEIFVEEIVGGPEPVLYADILGTVDGLKAFHCRRMGLRLVPDWPLEAAAPVQDSSTRPTASAHDITFDYASLLACALGKPSKAFGALYKRFDGYERGPRLPAPPYHFMSRIARVSGAIGEREIGSEVEAEYDIPADCWYFHASQTRSMPYAVLMEAALQPCGWLASYAGCAAVAEGEVFFRNLDGTATQTLEIGPGPGILVTKSRLSSISRFGPMTIVGFDVSCHLGGALVFTMKTVFGFFPADALANQLGLAPTPDDQRMLAAPSHISLDVHRDIGLRANLHLPDDQLLMIDRVTGLWPEGGRAELGAARGEKDVDPTDWFFKAHFFQDPVQPGSLGVQAMLQLLQVLMLKAGMADGITAPHFEPIMLGREAVWKYRGQVVPTNCCISTLVEITERGRDETGVFAIAAASLWVDGKKIYEMPRFGLRITPGEQAREYVFDLDMMAWISDHRPTFTVPTLPMAIIADLIAREGLRAGKDKVISLRDVSLTRWIAFDASPKRLKAAAFPREDGDLTVELALWRDSIHPGLSRFDHIAEGSVSFAGSYPRPPLAMSTPEGLARVHDLDDPNGPNLYADGGLFHGPAFQALRRLERGPQGAVGLIDAGLRGPQGILNPALLDAITHCIPNDELHIWSDAIPLDVLGYPSAFRHILLFTPVVKKGLVEARVRFTDFDDEARLRPCFQAQLLQENVVIAEAAIIYALFPKGNLGAAAPGERRRFLRDRHYVPGLRLSDIVDGGSNLSEKDIGRSDWLPGTIASVYGCEGVNDRARLLRLVAIKEHVAGLAETHPSEVIVADDETSATCSRYPLTRFPFAVADQNGAVRVTDAGLPQLDLSPVRAFWKRRTGTDESLVHDLYFGLIRRFLRRFVVVEPRLAITGRPVLYLANHQTFVEGLVFNVAASALFGCPITTLVKSEHMDGWVGALEDLTLAHPGFRLDPSLIYFDQARPETLGALLDGFARAAARSPRSLMIFAEGRRARSCREPVKRISSAIVDFALAHDLPIVPVRISGGLPEEPVAIKLDFPIGLAAQDHIVGAPLDPAELKRLTLKARSDLVLSAINSLLPQADEQPSPPASSYLARVERLTRDGSGFAQAVIREILLEDQNPCQETVELLSSLREGQNQLSQSWLRDVHNWLSQAPKVER